MSTNLRHLEQSVADWVVGLWTQLRAAFSATSAIEDRRDADVRASVDPEFHRWLRSDPMVTGNPASRYGDDSAGYLTSNGLGSLEIGAADD